MKQPIEARIIAYIESHPDKSSSEIAEGLGLSTGSVKPRLKALAIAHKISRTLVSNASGIGRQEFRYFGIVPRASDVKQKPVEPTSEPRPVENVLGCVYPTLPADPPVVKQAKDLDQIISNFAQQIAESVVTQALPLIIPKLREEMAKVVAEAASCVVERPGQPVTPKPEPKKLPSVFIGGLQPSATSPLLKEFSGVADLRFVTPEDHANMWKSRAANADHVIIMAGFVGHKHIEAVQSVGIKPILVHGGMTHLRDKILEVCVE